MGVVAGFLTAVVLLLPSPTSTAVSNPIAAAIQAAQPGDTVYVAAGTFTGSVTVPDGVTVVGQGSSSSWLKGKLTFGSNVVVRDLKIGDAGMYAVNNKDGASNTTFERVRFRGGGGVNWTYVVKLGGSGGDCDHVTFKDCQVERNLGVEVDGSDRGFNDVCIWTSANARVSDVTFEGCHIGVSNGQGGHDTGSPRMGLECFVSGGTTGYGWRNITLRNCVFEAADCHTADFSDQPEARGTGLLIEGCTFKGGGYTDVKWQWTLALEMPLNPVIRNNTFLRGNGVWGYELAIANRGNAGYTTTGATITGNLFDLDADNGIPPVTDGWPFVLKGYDNRFTDNTVRCHYGTKALFVLDSAYRNVISGNTLQIGSRSLVTQINGSSGNTVAPNAVN